MLVEHRFIIIKKENTMAYTKPKVLAQNSKQGSFAAGCPEKGTGASQDCKRCERTK